MSQPRPNPGGTLKDQVDIPYQAQSYSPEWYEEFCLYPSLDLQPTTVGRVLQKFRARAPGMSEICDFEVLYNPKEYPHAFWVVCYSQFGTKATQTLAQAIAEETKNATGSRKIRSIPRVTADLKTHDAASEEVDHAYDEFFYPSDIMKLKFRASWSRPDIYPCQFLIREVVDQIENETDVRIQLSLSGRIVFIGSMIDDPKGPLEACQRISVLQKYFMACMSWDHKFLHHLCYTEMHGEYEIDFQRPVSVHELLVSTAVPPQGVSIDTKKSKAVILTIRPTQEKWDNRCKLDDFWPHPGSKLRDDQKKQGFKPFEGFRWPETGLQDTAPRQATSANPNEVSQDQEDNDISYMANQDSVAQWRSGVDIGSVPDQRSVQEDQPSIEIPLQLTEIFNDIRGLHFGGLEGNLNEVDQSEQQVDQSEQQVDQSEQQVDEPEDLIEFEHVSASGNTSRSDQRSGPTTASSAPSKSKSTIKEVYHSSMRQKAVPRSTRPIKFSLRRDFDLYIQAFSGEMESALDKLLTGMRAWTGKLEINLRFGRLFLQGIGEDTITTAEHFKNNASGCDPSSALKSLGSLPRRQIVNCTALSYWPADANSLLSNPLWKPDGTRLFYIFTLVNNRDKFKVTIDSQDWTSSVSPIDKKTTQRRFYVHCPQRMWDFTVCLDGYSSSWVRQSHVAAANTLHQALQVKKQKVQVKLPPTCNFSIEKLEMNQSARCAHEKLKASMYVEKVTTMQYTLDDYEDGSQLWTATIPRTRPVYEARLKSGLLESVFQQNASLQLGQEASWKVEDLKLGYKSLYEPALEMIQHMDHIGSSNPDITI
ncbi:hypothetical protein MKZ38_004323 [Zalerion maritima]|uniref:Uncharacterized protein n=1 Tax=Zalerion maritima TaxID=339359 RepID=A0AAD5RLP2_9PEZI|nr:hypothetical protein MKZ38_004323 [Zalerion maritima]